MVDAKTILHIEDNYDNRLLVRRLLESDGFKVIEAENAGQAHQALQSTLPDLILMDINMPDIDGYTLTTEIKSNSKLRSVPVVAITANVMRGDREKVFNAGCNGYIEKPIDVDRFLDQIASFIG
ncbi:MAG TPA: response regulator [Anaerolineaceae bacterium]|nr:response regulator [Anaerolineaceae bacterium]